MPPYAAPPVPHGGWGPGYLPPTGAASGAPAPPGGVPAGPNQPVPAEAPLLVIGDILVTQDWVIVPQGRFPLRGTTWTMQDSTQITEAIPTWAIVCTIVFTIIFCVFGLLFLLAKEKRYLGFVAVIVAGDGLYHSVQLAPGPTVGAWAAHQVNQARVLAAAGR
jgi:hypothetical protein